MAVLSVQEASAEGVTPRGVEPEGPGYGSQAREPDPRRWVIGAAPDTVGAEEFARHTETLPRGWGLPRTLYQDLYQKLTARK